MFSCFKEEIKTGINDSKKNIKALKKDVSKIKSEARKHDWNL